MKRNSQQGVALVITLVLLSVITFMAVTFLVVSRSERQAVTTQADQSDARLAADAARERAIADMIVPIMAFSNANAFQMRVSTNFINPLGFQSALPPDGNRYTNVNYDGAEVGRNNLRPLTPPQMQQNIANLLYDPRPPVFIRTNGAPTGVSDFRYYLDLNRNGRFEPTGFVQATNNRNQPLVIKGIPVTNNVIGDPQWIGVLERPEFPHSATNKFVQRFAYLVLPAGAALDLNYIHNQTLSDTLNVRNDGYQRNQGFGSWEINLAAFLRDLNTNFWAYNYNRTIPPYTPNVGTAFEDAFSLLRYRYANNLNNLSTFQALFPPAAAVAFTRDGIDGYADGPLMTNVSGISLIPDDVPRRRWPGADNPQHFFNAQELFDTNKVATPFVNRLRLAGAANSTYDRYTYYRLLSQLATDSPAEPPQKMNLNYDNLVRVNAAGVASATNFYNWRPLDFFTNAADLMLRSATNLGIFGLSTTNIPIYPTNYYTPAVHRLLQLAANMYDATTNRNLTGYPYLPSVFRPRFGVNGTNIFISGYVEESPQIRPLAQFLTTPVRHLNFKADRDALQPDDLVYGVPLVIGAKEGFPNFNEYSMQSVVQVTRKLELRRANAFSRPFETNQMYVIGISNVFAVEAWNSYFYTNGFPRDLDLYVTNFLSIVMTNENGIIRSTNLALRQIIPINIPANTWQGLVNAQVAQQSFRIPLLTNVLYLSNSVYSSRQPYFRPLSVGFERGAGFAVPYWGLNITNNRLRYILVDRATQRVVDYVNLANLDSHIDITRELMGNLNIRGEASVMGQQWFTNRPQNSTSISTPTYGIINQLEVSAGNQQVGLADWNSYSLQGVSGLDKNKSIDAFRVFMGLSPIYYPGTFNSNIIQQAPFTPSRKLYQRMSWQANDPLVHYTLNDLADLIRTNDINFITPPNQPVPAMTNVAIINDRYQPWGGNPRKSTDPNAYNLALKDPLVRQSSDWDFPTNKFPNLGWLGRVHRGTPWQTVYLKSTPVENATWAKWTGNDINPVQSLPMQDWNLLDLFTVSPNDNASRGQMSINNSDIAGWSAILSGVMVLTNSATDKELRDKPLETRFDPVIIEPVGLDGTNSPLSRIVEALNRDRANVAVHPDQTFHRLGDILATPELTVASPYLNRTNSIQLERGLSDPVYERIPQQILSLLKVGEPRFVIYAYGQSLKPADRSILQTGPFTGMCTNYQITGETATRTVVRIEGAPNNPRAVIESFNVLPPD